MIMESQNNSAKKPAAPHTLPVFDDKNVEVHTMQQDMQKMHPTIPEQTDQKQAKMPEEPKMDMPEIPKLEIPEPPKPPIPELTSPMSPASAEKKPSPFDRFRKPKEVKEASTGISKFKAMLPKTSADEKVSTEQETKNKTPTERPVIPPMEIPEREPIPTPPQNDLEIKIPEERSKLPMMIVMIATLVVLIGGAGLGYYWFFVRESAPIAEQPAAEQQPNVVQIPDQQQTQVEAPAPIPEEPKVVELPEPAVPTSSIYFDQTAITTVTKLDQSEIVNGLRSDVDAMIGGGAITRHLFKISNPQEKRFALTPELLRAMNIFIPNNVMAELSNIEFVSYKIDSKVRYGLIAQISNKDNVLAKMKGWEVQSIQDLKQLFMGEPITIPESPEFSENAYLDFTKRYINLTDSDMSLDYAVSDKYLIIATSKDMMFASILQTQK